MCRDYAAAAALQAKLDEGAVESEAALGATDEAAPSGGEAEGPHTSGGDETEDISEEEEEEHGEETRVLKMLYKGNMEEVNRREEQARKAKVVNHKHKYYKQTRCTSTTQEAQSALPAGAINVHEDSDEASSAAGREGRGRVESGSLCSREL